MAGKAFTSLKIDSMPVGRTPDQVCLIFQIRHIKSVGFCGGVAAGSRRKLGA